MKLLLLVACLSLLGSKIASAECSDIRTPYYCSKQICYTCYNQGRPYRCNCITNNYICGYDTREVCSNTSGGENMVPPPAPPTQEENDE
jgi:hypothetical protein